MAGIDIREYEPTLINVENIKTDGDNPNEMDEDTKKRLRESMKTWGNTQPIVVDKNTMLLADGEHRLKMYIAADKKQIPVFLVPFESDADRRAYRQAANKIRGMHVPERDTAEYRRILEAGRGDLLEVATGMKLGEVEKHMRRYGPSDDELNVDEDQFPIDPQRKPLYDIKPGDVYELGQHRLVCGDSTDPATYQAALGVKSGAVRKVDCILTDPPYNLDFRGTNKGKFDEMANDNKEEQVYQEFVTAAATQMRTQLSQHASTYLFIDWRNYPTWYQAIQKTGLDILNCVVWDKIYAGLGYKYRFRHEFCIYAGERAHITWRGDTAQEDVIKFEHLPIKPNGVSARILDHKGVCIPLGASGDYLRLKLEQEPPKRVPIIEDLPPYTFKTKKAGVDNIIENLSMNNFVQRRSEDETGIVHPTMKPIRLLARLIMNSTQQGDLVLDPFGGSGSTLMACEQTNRQCATIELSPDYASLILERWEKYTRQKAQKVKNT